MEGAIGTGTPLPNGREYEIEVVFPKEPAPDEAFYVGYLEAAARRGNAVVGTLAGRHAHRVEVYPLVKIVPSPGVGDALLGRGGTEQRALGRGELGCARFRLELDVGRLPHPDRDAYAIRAQLSPKLQLNGPLEGAQFQLDGLSLEIEGQVPDPKTPISPWTQGRELSREEFLGGHEICIKVGKHSIPSQVALELPLQWTLMESPYDEFRVVQPFVFKAVIARIRPIDRWRSLLLLGLLTLLLLAALWYLRDRPELPEDLVVALGRDRGSLEVRPLPSGTSFRGLLGRVEERPILPSGAGRALAWLRPTKTELYRLRPGRGVRLEALEKQSLAEVPSGRLRDVEVEKIYRLRKDDEAFLMRVEYQ